MGAEGQQDVEMAILTALLKGELRGSGDSVFCLLRAVWQGLCQYQVLLCFPSYQGLRVTEP